MYHSDDEEFKKFKEKIDTIKKYINVYKKAPSLNDKIPEVRKLAKWIATQYEEYEEDISNMIYVNIREYWEKFLDEFDVLKSIEQVWYEKLFKVKQFIDDYDEQDEPNKEINKWILLQCHHYYSKTFIMSNESIRNCWEYFQELYPDYFEKYFEYNSDGWCSIKRFNRT